MSSIVSLVFYIVIIITSGIMFSLSKKHYRTKIINDMFWMLSILIPAFVSCLRYEVGTDYHNYDWTITYIRGISFQQILLHGYSLVKMEPGFIIIIKILSFIFSNKVIFGVLNGITILFITRALIEQYDNIIDSDVSYLAFLFLFYPASLNIVRQMLAVSIVFWGFKYFINRKYFSYFLFVILATMIHSSAIVSIPIIFILKKDVLKRINISFLLIYSIVILFFSIFWKNIIGLGAQLINSDALSKYVDLYSTSNGLSNKSFFIKLVMFAILIVLYKYLKNNNIFKIFLALYFIAILFEYIGFSLSFIKRIGLYYSVGIIVLIGTIPFAFDKKSQLSIKALIYILLLVYFVFDTFILGHNGIYPYKY